MQEVTRFFAILGVFALTLLPERNLQMFKQSNIQLIAATIVALVLVLHDVLAGLFLGVGLIIVYYRLYNDIIAGSVTDRAVDVRDKGPMACIMGSRYITDDDLINAQTNIVDDSQIDTQIIGISGLNSEQVFGAQGLHKQISGMDTTTNYSDAQFK